MAEDRERLQRLLADLRSQLAASATLDAGVRARLEETVAEIEAAINRPIEVVVSPRPGNSSLTHRLSEATLEFEASHPTLSGAVGSVIDALSRMGI